MCACRSCSKRQEVVHTLSQHMYLCSFTVPVPNAGDAASLCFPHHAATHSPVHPYCQTLGTYLSSEHLCLQCIQQCCQKFMSIFLPAEAPSAVQTSHSSTHSCRTDGRGALSSFTAVAEHHQQPQSSLEVLSLKAMACSHPREY